MGGEGRGGEGKGKGEGKGEREGREAEELAPPNTKTKLRLWGNNQRHQGRNLLHAPSNVVEILVAAISRSLVKVAAY
jgi:hypothetical protein